MIKDGSYKARAKRWSVGYSASGTPKIDVLFEIIDSPGEEITWAAYLSDNALPYSVKALRICGWDGDDIDDLDGLDCNEVSLVIETQCYNGKQVQRVRYVNAASGIQDQVERKTFAESMRAKIIGLEPTRVHVKRTKTTDEDIPF